MSKVDGIQKNATDQVLGGGLRGICLGQGGRSTLVFQRGLAAVRIYLILIFKCIFREIQHFYKVGVIWKNATDLVLGGGIRRTGLGRAFGLRLFFRGVQSLSEYILFGILGAFLRKQIMSTVDVIWKNVTEWVLGKWSQEKLFGEVTWSTLFLQM